MDEKIVKTVTVVHKGHTDGRRKREKVFMEAVSSGKAIRIYEAMQELQQVNPVKAAEVFMQHRRSYWIHPNGSYRRLFHHNDRKMNRNMNALNALRKK